MQVTLQYGTTNLDLALPEAQVTVLAPRFVPGLPDEEAAFRQAVRTPIEARPLAESVAPGERVAIVVADITRPLPERTAPAVDPAGARSCPAGADHHRHRHRVASCDHAVRDRHHRRRGHRQRLPDRRSQRLRRLRPGARRDRHRRPAGLHEPRLRRGRPAGHPRLRRAALHGGILGRLQGGVPRRRGHRRDHAVSRCPHDRSSAQHLGPCRGQSDADPHPSRRRAAAGRLLRERDAQPAQGDHRLLLRRRARRARRRAAPSRARPR